MPLDRPLDAGVPCTEASGPLPDDASDFTDLTEAGSDFTCDLKEAGVCDFASGLTDPGSAGLGVAMSYQDVGELVSLFGLTRSICLTSLSLPSACARLAKCCARESGWAPELDEAPPVTPLLSWPSGNSDLCSL